MGYGDDRAFVLEQYRFQGFAALDIQIVGRFVQKQHIRGARHQTGEHDAPPLAAAERTDRLVRGVAADSHPAQERACAFGCHAAAIDHFVNGGAIHVELVVRVLREVRDLGCRIETHAAGIGVEFSRQNLEKRRFSRTVGTDDRNAFAAFDVDREIGEQRLRVSLSQRARFERETVSGAARGVEAHGNRCFGRDRRRRFARFDLRELFFAAAHLRVIR